MRIKITVKRCDTDEIIKNIGTFPPETANRVAEDCDKKIDPEVFYVDMEETNEPVKFRGGARR
jgi:hypothetical protein